MFEIIVFQDNDYLEDILVSTGKFISREYAMLGEYFTSKVLLNLNIS